jgi:deoxycytidine triphosphate deaminase
VAAWFYGPAGLAALETILAAYAVSSPTPSHPQPALRLAIQKAAEAEDLVAFKPVGDTFGSPQNQATAALIELAVQLRGDVCDQLKANVGAVDAVADGVAAKVVGSLELGLVPSSSDWPTDGVAPGATAIESGLVRGLWRRRGTLAENLPASDDLMTRDVRFVSQAIDALEFAARFDGQREDLGVEARERMPLPNVLWLGMMGVRTSEEQESGVPAHDLRLGRIFTVFQRASVSDINSLAGDADLSVIQREVQVGWGDHFVLHQAELVLATTFESLRLDNDVSAQVLSRSSVGRLGLLSATAVQVHPGFRGCLTLELVNLANVPLRLTPGQRVAQIVPLPALGVTPGYEGGYQDAGPKPGLTRTQHDWDADVLWRMSAKPL